jgi:hypothetical protein
LAFESPSSHPVHSLSSIAERVADLLAGCNIADFDPERIFDFEKTTARFLDQLNHLCRNGFLFNFFRSVVAVPVIRFKYRIFPVCSWTLLSFPNNTSEWFGTFVWHSFLPCNMVVSKTLLLSSHLLWSSKSISPSVVIGSTLVGIPNVMSSYLHSNMVPKEEDTRVD